MNLVMDPAEMIGSAVTAVGGFVQVFDAEIFAHGVWATCRDCGDAIAGTCLRCAYVEPVDVSWLDVCPDNCICLCCNDDSPVWAHEVTPYAAPRTWQDDVVELARFNTEEL